MAKRKGKAEDEHGALAPREDAWGLGRKAVEIPSQAALKLMEEEQLGDVAREHHGQARKIVERDALPHVIVAGLCLREAKERVQGRGDSWARWLETHWHMSEWSARQYMGAAAAREKLGEATSRTPEQLMATMAQAVRAIGCAELAKPAAREPRKPTPAAAPDPVINATYTIKPPAPELEPPPVCSNCKQPASEGRPLDRLGTAFDPTGRATAWSWTHVGCLHPQDARLARERAGVDQDQEDDEDAGPLDGVESGEPYGTDDEAEPDLPDEEGPTLRGALEERGLLWGPAKSGALNRFDVTDPVSNKPLLEGAGLMEIWAWLKDQDEESPVLEDRLDRALGQADLLEAEPGPAIDLGPACTCGHIEDEHSGAFGTCATGDCPCDGFDGGIDVPGALTNLWAAYKEASPQARPLILRAIELLGDDPGDAAAIDQEDADETPADAGDGDDEELLEEEAQAAAPGQRVQQLEEEVRAKLGPAVLSTEERAALAARLQENPLDVEAIRVADDRGELGALIRPRQRAWARLWCEAEEVKRELNLLRPGVTAQERDELYGVLQDLGRPLQRLKALVQGERPDPDGQWPTAGDLNDALEELREHPLRTAPVAVLLFRQRQVIPRVYESFGGGSEVLERDVDPSQGVYAVVSGAYAALEGIHFRTSSVDGRESIKRVRRALHPAVDLAEAEVKERCGDGKVPQAIARSAERAKAAKAKTQAEQEKKAAKKAAKPKVDSLPRGKCSVCPADVAVRRGGEVREHNDKRIGAKGTCAGSGKPSRPKNKKGGKK